MSTLKPPQAAPDPAAMLDELEADIEALRVLYDKYFLGIERAAPTRPRDRLDRKLRTLEGVHLSSTALRFRLGGLRARYIAYAQYWTRILDQMERGVFKRDSIRAAQRTAAAATESPRSAATPSEPAPAAASAALIDPAHAREVFDRLVAAKLALGEATDGLTFPAFLRKLNREAPKLSEQHGGAALRFEVEVKGNKVRVRARAV
ncbi:MAG: hypothetical protein K1X88_14190 [Nannocystaceae bacterium]|nr:hypothetical protein [Nannocystaceae bacterium]